MKEITYLIPTKYLNSKLPATKPIAVRAWETATKGLIVQRPIEPSRRGEVHLMKFEEVAARWTGRVTKRRRQARRRRKG